MIWKKEAKEFLAAGITANPESCLLAFKQADRLELSTTNGGDDDSKAKRGKTVREPYDRLLDALYILITKAMTRETRDLARVEEQFKQPETNGASYNDDDDEEAEEKKVKQQEAKKQASIDMIKTVSGVHISILSKTISHAWIALMRAMQRMQGKGRPGSVVGGSRQIFSDARKRGTNYQRCVDRRRYDRVPCSRWGRVCKEDF